MALQKEMLISVFKPPIFLPGGEPVEVDNLTNNHIPPPILPEAFCDPAGMQRAFIAIYRWRFLYSYTHREDWTADSAGFRQIQSLLLEWYNLAEEYIQRLKRERDPSSAASLQSAVGMTVYVRMMYTALHYSVLTCDKTESPSDEQHLPLRPNFIDLSHPEKVVVLVLIKYSSAQDDIEDWQLAAIENKTCHASRKRAPDPWPEIDFVTGSDGKPVYVRFTNYTSS